MGKKQLQVEELESDEEFDGNFDDSGDDDAPVAISKKDAQAKYEKAP